MPPICLCVILDLFDWVTHTSVGWLPRNGVRSGVGATLAQAQGCRPPDGHAHTRAAKGKATLCKQIAGASAVPLGYKARVCHIIVCCRRDPT